MCGCGKSTTQQSSGAGATTNAPMRSAQGASMRPPSNARSNSGTASDEVRDTRAAHGSAPTTMRGNDIPLRYRGTRALLVRGPATGVGYACYPGDTISVHERDVAQLIGSGSFIRAAS